MISTHLSFVGKVQWFCLDTNYFGGAELGGCAGTRLSRGELGGLWMMLYHISIIQAELMADAVHLETSQQPF